VEGKCLCEKTRVSFSALCRASVRARQGTCTTWAFLHSSEEKFMTPELVPTAGGPDVVPNPVPMPDPQPPNPDPTPEPAPVPPVPEPALTNPLSVDLEITLEFVGLDIRGKTEPKCFNVSMALDNIPNRTSGGLDGLWAVNCPRCNLGGMFFMSMRNLTTFAEALARKRQLITELGNSCPNHQSEWLMAMDEVDARRLSLLVRLLPSRVPSLLRLGRGQVRHPRGAGGLMSGAASKAVALFN
jgi:hypothetical protein